MLSFLVAAGLLVPAALQAQQVELRWRFSPGEAYMYRHAQTTEIGSGMGQVTQSQTSSVRQEVLSLADDGAADLRVTHESVRIAVESPMGQQEWDSESGDEPTDPAFRPMAELLGSSFEMTIAPDGQIRSVSGTDELLERIVAALPGGDPAVQAQTQQMLERMFGEDGMQTLIPQGSQSFPSEPVAVGAEWQHDTRMPLPFGEMHLEYLYRLRDIVTEGDAQIAYIEVGGSVGAMEADPGNPMAAMMELSGGELNGELEFDVSRGLLRRASLTSDVAMSIADQTMNIRSTQEMELLGVEPGS